MPDPPPRRRPPGATARRGAAPPRTGGGRPRGATPGRPSRRRRGPAPLVVVVAVLAVAAVAVGAALALRGGPDDGAAAAARAYARAWTSGDDEAAAAATDAPARAVAVLRASRAGLDRASVVARVTRTTEDGDRATAGLAVRWRVPGVGRYAYTTTLPLRRDGDRWVVRWSPRDVHPRLGPTTRLGTAVDVPARAPVLDREDRALVGNRAVVDVAVRVDARTDAGATARRLGAVLGDDVDPAALRRALTAAPDGRYVPVVTLRRAAFLAHRDALLAIPGVTTAEGTRPLAPTRDFGRALLGTVGPATAEQVAAARKAGRDLPAGALAGQSGLEAAHDARLAGAPARRVVLRDRAVGDVVRTLLRRPGTRPRAVRTTLDRDVQAAAETALGDVRGNAALVAVQPSTGDVLAVANRPGDSTYDRALTGRYPPGSTFKVVSTAALLRSGLRPGDTVPCPATRTVDGKAFRNFEGEAAGGVPFRTDFAQSCNTAFVSLADRLRAGDLTRVARDFGLGRAARPGVAVADASVPPADGDVSQAAMMIGQDRIVASPLAMAGVAATVADGRWRAPRVLAGDPRAAGPALPAGELATLRELMRGVVTGGTGTALAGLPGAPAGKSGTAEYGGGDPPPTHAWFIAYRGDVAVAVLVENGRSGGSVAAPVAARFYGALDA